MRVERVVVADEKRVGVVLQELFQAAKLFLQSMQETASGARG